MLASTQEAEYGKAHCFTKESDPVPWVAVWLDRLFQSHCFCVLSRILHNAHTCAHATESVKRKKERGEMGCSFLSMPNPVFRAVFLTKRGEIGVSWWRQRIKRRGTGENAEATLLGFLSMHIHDKTGHYFIRGSDYSAMRPLSFYCDKGTFSKNREPSVLSLRFALKTLECQTENYFCQARCHHFCGSGFEASQQPFQLKQYRFIRMDIK